MRDAVDVACDLALFFFFQAEDGIRDVAVTGVQTCALPISIAGAAPYRRETVVADHVGRECATGAPPTVTCKRVRVTVSYRPVSGGGGPGHERRVGLVTVFVPPVFGGGRCAAPPRAGARPGAPA